jgi:hypothetical protein
VSTASNVAGDITSVVLVLMILGIVGLGWWWLVLWMVAQCVKMRHYIRDGSPDYKYLARMEQVLFIDNVQRALDVEARERAERA